MLIYQFALFFFIYAFLGWCTEVAYAALETGAFVNRGFLNGPVCPIYGVGMCIVISCLTPFLGNLFLLFAAALILTTLLEWGTGFLMEKIFHERWWDYSDEPFNIGGYICLRFSIIWGLSCVFVMKLIHPIIAYAVVILPLTAGTVLLLAFSAGIFTDLGVTAATVAGLNKRLKLVDSMASGIRKVSGGIGERVSEDTMIVGRVMGENGILFTEQSEEDKQKLEETKESAAQVIGGKVAPVAAALSEKTQGAQEKFSAGREKLAVQSELLAMKITLGQRRIMKAFPRMRSIPYKEALESLKNRMKDKDADGNRRKKEH